MGFAVRVPLFFSGRGEAVRAALAARVVMEALRERTVRISILHLKIKLGWIVNQATQ